MNKTVAFTGYRPSKLPFAEDEQDMQYVAFRKNLKRVINRLVERGYTDFVSGLAEGFDTWAAEEIIELKKQKKDVRLECAIPFPGQADSWDNAGKKRRKKILKQADDDITVCDHYFNGCYFVRNEYMVNKADVIVCCYDGQKGGTGYTVSYAQKKDKIIIQIDPKDARVSIISKRNFEVK